MSFLKRILSNFESRTIFSVRNLDELLNTDDIYQSIAVLDDIIAKACNYGDDLQNLTEPQKIFYFLQSLQAQVNNGGFDQYFFNFSGRFAHEALVALNAVDAPYTAGLLREGIQQFPGEKVPNDTDIRRELLINELSERAEKAWNSLDDKFYLDKEDLDALCFEYIRKNRDEF